MLIAPRATLSVGFFCSALALASFTASAQAQDDVRYADEPTGGVHLPSVGLAGEFDATAVTVNPAGMSLLSGGQLALALDLSRERGAVRGGPGGGIYYAASLGGGLLPQLGVGMAVEWLRAARSELTPDPGTPTRLTLSTSLRTGKSSALGFAHHHFYDSGGALGGLDTYDIGWTSRFGAHWAAGLVWRDIGSPNVAGEAVQSRYELELVSRPLGTDRLEIGLGGRVGQDHVDLAEGHAIDGWLKWSLRVARGVYLRGEVGTESLRRITTSATSTTEDFLRDYRLSAGLEFSFGGLGTTAYGTLERDADGDTAATGGTFVARLSPVHVPSVLPQGKRMERLELKGGITQRSLTSTVAYLRNLATDDDVVGLFINFDGMFGGWATLHELRAEIAKLRASGKKVFAFMIEGDTRQYFVASAADKVYVDPAGGIRLQGFAGTSLYFAGLFEKIGVQAQFQRIGEYKSAPESWTRTGPTEPAFRMRNELYDSLYSTLVKEMTASRGVSEKRMRTLIDNGPYTAGDLEKLPDLVDAVVTSDDLPPLIAKEMGRYYRFASAPPTRPETWDRRKIAVIYIIGDIVGGKSRTVPLLGRTMVGADTITEALAQANGDPDIEAIVLRINSPGGSALASEFMARAVKKVRGTKPIICSMGDLAASGGYFAAAYCDRIFADPMTITGSIGIFNGTFDISGLLSKLGLSWTTFKRGANSDFGSPYKAMTEAEQKLMQQKLHYFYGRFLNVVAEGRGMKTEEVNEVGRGHVWSGEQSIAIDLVDELGGVMDAISYAKKMSGFADGEKASVIMLPEVDQSLLSQILGGGPLGRLAAEKDSQTMGQLAPLVNLLGLLPGDSGAQLKEAIPASLWSEPGQPQARLPFAIVWD